MRKGVLDILKGKFLVNGETAPKNWIFILFISFLAAVMIASSHSADSKVHEIAALNEQVKELRSEFIDGQTDVQKLKLESEILKTLGEDGLFPSENPPFKIRVKSAE